MTTTLWSIVGYSYHTCETDTLAIGASEQKIRAMFTKYISGEMRAERYVSITSLSLLRMTLVNDTVTRETEIVRVNTDSLYWWRESVNES